MLDKKNFKIYFGYKYEKREICVVMKFKRGIIDLGFVGLLLLLLL